MEILLCLIQDLLVSDRDSSWICQCFVTTAKKKKLKPLSVVQKKWGERMNVICTKKLFSRFSPVVLLSFFHSCSFVAEWTTIAAITEDKDVLSRGCEWCWSHRRGQTINLQLWLDVPLAKIFKLCTRNKSTAVACMNVRACVRVWTRAWGEIVVHSAPRIQWRLRIEGEMLSSRST